jgi:hypothetical protein
VQQIEVRRQRSTLGDGLADRPAVLSALAAAAVHRDVVAAEGEDEQAEQAEQRVILDRSLGKRLV